MYDPNDPRDQRGAQPHSAARPIILDEHGDLIKPRFGRKSVDRDEIAAHATRLDPIDRAGDPNEMQTYEALLRQHPPAVNVQVDNNHQTYRPWKEELLLSGIRTLGNGLAWPFRLMGALFASLIDMASGLIRIGFMVFVVPSLLYSGCAFMEANKDKTATETAYDAGKTGVGVIGSVAGGIWDGMFGSDTDPAKPDSPASKDGNP